MFISRKFARPLTDTIKRWEAAAYTQGARMSRRRLQLYSTFERRARANGYWSKLVELPWYRPEAGTTTSMEAQCLVGWKKRVVAVPMGTPSFTGNGLLLNGTDQYVRLGIIPNVYSEWTGSSITVGGLERGVATSGDLLGVNEVTSTRNIRYRPKVSSAQTAQLNCSSTAGPAPGSSSGHTSANRDGSSGAFLEYRVEGVATGTTSPATNGTTLPSTEIYGGALNTAATPSNFRRTTIEYLILSGLLTAAEELALIADLAWLRNAIGYSDINVSAVDFGGIPVGNDTTGQGTAAAPFASFNTGFSATPAPAVLAFNGDTASPTDYLSASAVMRLNKRCSLTSTNSRGARLASGSGTTLAVSVEPSAGEPTGIAKLIVDASKNTAGAALSGIVFAAKSTKYSFNANDMLVTGFTGAGQGISATAANVRADIDLSNTDVTGATTRGGVHLVTLVEGGLNYSTGTVTLTDQSTSGFGGIVVRAQAAGVLCNVFNVGVSVTLDAALTSTGMHLGIEAQNIAGAVLDGGGTKSISVLGAPGSRQGTLARIVTNLAGDATELPIDGGIIRDWTGCSITTNGGVGFQAGDDGGDRAKALDLLIEDCDGAGDAEFANDGGHVVFGCNTTRLIVRNIEWELGGIGAVDKRSTDALWEDCIWTDVDNSILVKGSEGSIHRRHHCIATGLRNDQKMLFIHADTDPGGTDSADITVEDCIFEVQGGTGQIFIDVEVGQTWNPTGNTLIKSGGTLHAAPVTVHGVVYATGAEFMAAFPGNTAIGW